MYRCLVISNRINYKDGCHRFLLRNQPQKRYALSVNWYVIYLNLNYIRNNLKRNFGNKKPATAPRIIFKTKSVTPQNIPENSIPKISGFENHA